MKNLLTLIFLFAFIVSGCSLFKLTPSKKIGQISFSSTEQNPTFQFVYQNLYNSPDLAQLQTRYQLDKVIEGTDNELEKILRLLNWTNSRWEHNGSNTPSQSNTLTILEEAETGKKFRCVEYGIVLKSVLAANGFYARTLGLKTRDVESTRLGAGHVLSEVWSETNQKWVLIDAQFNVLPMLNGVPLNAVELQEAIVNRTSFNLIDINGEISEKRRKQFLSFIPHYLYYFDYKFDQRDLKYADLFKVEDKAVLMLVPVGANKPTIFQRKNEMDYLAYTHSLLDFYQKPY